MYWLIKEAFISWLCFSESLASKCMSLNNEPWMVSSTLFNLDPVDLDYYSFMISLEKCSGGCNSVDGLSAKICFPSKAKDVNVKVFNIITNRNEAKLLIKHISSDFKCKFHSATCSSNQKLNNETYHSLNHSTCFCENGKHIKHIVDNLNIVCDEIACAIDIVSRNVTSTVSINFNDKKARYKKDCYILHSVL